MRTLDAGGRLSLPVVCDGAAELPARRTQTVLTVHLPGSASKPTERATASVGLRGGQLTLGKALRALLGIADRADVLVLHDPEALAITLTAASRLDTLVADTLTALANGTRAAFVDQPSRDELVPAEDQPNDQVGGHLRLVSTRLSPTARTGELA